MHRIKGWTTWAKVPLAPIHIVLVDSEVIVDLEGEVRDSVYVFLGPPEATSVGARDIDSELIMEQCEVYLNAKFKEEASMHLCYSSFE